MNKRRLAVLEKVYSAEIGAALGERVSHLFQTKSRIAEDLEREGFLRTRSEVLSGLPPVRISGYELTELGRFAYCVTCEDGPEE